MKRVTVAGAGAIGTLMAARLAHAGHRVSLLARGATLQAVRERGLRLDDLGGVIDVHVDADDRASFGVQDAVFLCCKSHDLPDLAEQAAPLIGPDTLIVPMCNGVPFWYFHGDGGRFDGQPVRAVDPDGRIARALPLAQVIGAVTFITAEATSPGRVTARNPHLVMFGEPSNVLSPRLQTLCNLVATAGLEARPIERIRDKLWTKIIANLTSNPLSVVTGLTLDQIFTRADTLPTVQAVMREAMLTAASHGARMTVDPIEMVALSAGMGAVRTSMLQDHQRGRPLELAAIGDAVIELADRYGLPMDATRALLARAHAASARLEAIA